MIACVDFFVPAGDMRGLFAHFAQRDLKYEPAADHGSIGRGIMRPRSAVTNRRRVRSCIRRLQHRADREVGLGLASRLSSARRSAQT
jgi:hypothetical protein